MGAGNAKGLRKSASADDVDDVSVASDGQWDDNRPQNADGNAGASDHHRSKSFDFPQSTDKNKSDLRVVHDDTEEQHSKKENKRGGFFHFRKERDDSKHDEDTDSDPDSKENENRRFKFFGRKKDKPQKDDKLDSEINDLEKTFDSLGILGKENKKEGSEKRPSIRSKDDLDSLEPMRNRLNVRAPRPPRGLNGLTTGRDFMGRRSSDFTGASSGSSKKRFNFSWENDDETQRPVKQDEWSYQTVQIEGFDINKFKQANKQNSMEVNIRGSISAPVSSGGMGSSSSDSPYGQRPGSSTPASPLHYDADDKRILESIERALGD